MYVQRLETTERARASLDEPGEGDEKTEIIRWRMVYIQSGDETEDAMETTRDVGRDKTCNIA